MKCLVVDDSEDNTFILWKMLTKHGFEVAIADTAQQGLDLCAKAMPEIIFLDWKMPEMDGIEFLKRLHYIPEGNKACVIMCTGVNDANEVKMALKKGVRGYIVKPFTEATLLKQIDNVVSR